MRERPGRVIAAFVGVVVILLAGLLVNERREHRATERALFDDYRAGYASIKPASPARRAQGLASRPCELRVLSAYPQSGGAGGDKFRDHNDARAFYAGCQVKRAGARSDPQGGVDTVLYGDD